MNNVTSDGVKMTGDLFLVGVTPPRSRVQEEHKISAQLQEQILQPVDAESAECEPVHGLSQDPDLRLEDDGLSRHHRHRE